MLNEILVVTEDAPFGELIRHSLEETGQFNVFVTGNAAEAKSYLQTKNCNTIFLDPGTEIEAMLALGRELCQIRPGARFVVTVEAGQSIPLEELLPQDYLSKPFYLPDLMETVNKLFPEENKANGRQMKDKETQLPETPAWMSDVTRAAQHLTRLTLQSSAQAALITQNEELWAYAGQLPHSAARELTDVVARYWDREEQNDLVRFVRLASTNAEHMLYATLLRPSMILVMVFDAETPFSTIRSQANQLVHSLSISPPEEPAAESETPQASISDILFDVPPPNPEGKQPPSRVGVDTQILSDEPGPIEETSVSRKRYSAERDIHSTNFSRESSPAVPVGALHTDNRMMGASPERGVALEDELAVTVKSKARKKMAEEPEKDLSDTRPRSITEVTGKIALEPVSPAVFSLQYACLLIPRFTHHHLTGDLSEKLSKWVSEICIAFGWRLEYLSVRPDYLQWVVNVPPATSPGFLMRVMRQHTSERIFADFPALARENPSGDFWAPGYLIMGGAQPPPAQLIKNFIAQTRQRQGISQRVRR